MAPQESLMCGGNIPKRRTHSCAKNFVYLPFINIVINSTLLQQHMRVTISCRSALSLMGRCFCFQLTSVVALSRPVLAFGELVNPLSPNAVSSRIKFRAVGRPNFRCNEFVRKLLNCLACMMSDWMMLTGFTCFQRCYQRLTVSAFYFDGRQCRFMYKVLQKKTYLLEPENVLAIHRVLTHLEARTCKLLEW